MGDGGQAKQRRTVQPLRDGRWTPKNLFLPTSTANVVGRSRTRHCRRSRPTGYKGPVATAVWRSSSCTRPTCVRSKRRRHLRICNDSRWSDESSLTGDMERVAARMACSGIWRTVDRRLIDS